MAISITWPTGVIYVPKADLTLIQLSPEIRELNLNWFRLQLRDLEDSEEGMAWLETHVHVTETVLSGTTYARFVIITNGYTVEFENGLYQVNCVGANHNLGDVKIVNSVSLIVNNSAGLQTVVSGSGVTPQDKIDIAGLSADAVCDELLAGHQISGSLGEMLRDLADRFKGEWKLEPATFQMILYRPGGTELARFNLFNAAGEPAVTNVVRRVPVP